MSTSISKHLKGQLEPPMSDEKVCVTKKNTFSSCVSNRRVIISLSICLKNFLTRNNVVDVKVGSSSDSDVTFLDHQVGAPCEWRNVFPSPDDRAPSGEHDNHDDLYIMLMWRFFVCLSRLVIIQIFPNFVKFFKLFSSFSHFFPFNHEKPWKTNLKP